MPKEISGTSIMHPTINNRTKPQPTDPLLSFSNPSAFKRRTRYPSIQKPPPPQTLSPISSMLKINFLLPPILLNGDQIAYFLYHARRPQRPRAKFFMQRAPGYRHSRPHFYYLKFPINYLYYAFVCFTRCETPAHTTSEMLISQGSKF